MLCVHMQPDHIKKGYCPRLPGVRMPATYINHYAANGGVVVPQFGGVCLLPTSCPANAPAKTEVLVNQQSVSTTMLSDAAGVSPCCARVVWR